jgi:OmpR family response regulator RpaB
MTFIKKILVADSDIKTSYALETVFNSLYYKTLLTSNGRDALKIFNKENPDLVILDILLPTIDGYEVCRRIREVSEVPIIILTSLTKTLNRIIGFELGADDYITKPFAQKELEVRIKSLLCRTLLRSKKLYKKKYTVFQIGNLVVDPNTQIILNNNLEINLTNLEYSVFKFLIDNAGISLSRIFILENVWGYTPERIVDTRIVDVTISRLRAKVEKDPHNPDLILTSRGKGYMFRK